MSEPEKTGDECTLEGVTEFPKRTRGLVTESGRKPYFIHSVLASKAIQAGIIKPSGNGVSHIDASGQHWIIDDNVPLRR